MEDLEIKLDGKQIKVKIKRRNNKNIYFRFDEENNLVVSVHPRISTKKIIKLIEENEKAIMRMYERNKRKQVEEGEVRLLGLKYEVEINDAYKEILFDNGIIYVNSKTKLDSYISELTSQVLKEETDKIVEMMPNIPKFTLKLRKMKTRWGVCNYVKKTVTLNSELIKYERNIIDYVIVHELSHFTYHDHSKNFWNYVAQYYPNYKNARKELREV